MRLKWGHRCETFLKKRKGSVQMEVLMKTVIIRPGGEGTEGGAERPLWETGRDYSPPHQGVQWLGCRRSRGSRQSSLYGELEPYLIIWLCRNSTGRGIEFFWRSHPTARGWPSDSATVSALKAEVHPCCTRTAGSVLSFQKRFPSSVIPSTLTETFSSSHSNSPNPDLLQPLWPCYFLHAWV